MSDKYRYGQPIPERLLQLEKPGEPLLFDADRALVADVSAACDIKAFVGGLKGKSEKEAGIEYQGLPCRALCLTAFQAAAEKTGDKLRPELAKNLPQDSLCEFAFFSE